MADKKKHIENSDYIKKLWSFVCSMILCRLSGSNRLFGDGAHIIYVNGENREDTALGYLMADFACNEPDRFYYQELADETRYYKYDEKGVRRMCKIMEDIAKERSEQIALNMLADGKLSVKDIAKYSGLTVTEVKALAKKSRRKCGLA